MSSSYSGGSASSSSGQQLGARPKIARQLLLLQQQQQQQQQQMNQSTNRSSLGQHQSSRASHHHRSSSSKENKEWNSNWNSILSAQGDEQSCAKGQSQQQPDMMMRSQGNNNVNQHNGQPPSTAAAAIVKNQEPSRHEIRPGRDGMSPVTAQWTALQPSAVSRGFSDPSLAVVQPASNNNGSVGCGGSSELFHSHHYHARRQRQQQSVNSNCNSRSSSAADLSLLQSSTVNLSSLGNQHGSASSSLNNVNHIKDSSSGGGGGISSIWARWFRRNNNNSHRPSSSSIRPFSSAAVYGGGGGGGAAGSRSHSVENSPVVSRRLRHHPSMMTGSSGQLASSDNNSDSLSTNSFSFIRTPTDKSNDPAAVAMTLRRKYGLMACSNESTDKVLLGNNLHNNIEGDAIRAMRTQWETQMKQMDEILRSREEQPDNNKCNNNKRLSQTNNNNSTARKKRPAPQPPPPPPPNSGTSSRHSTHNRSSSSVASGSGFTHVPGKRKAPSPPDSATTNTFNIVAPPHPVLPDLMESTPPEASPPVENNKWSNDLNCNLLLDENNQVRSSSKVLRYQQNKFDNDCPHNDILKLEGGVLRPLDSSNSNKQQAEASGSTLDYPTHRGSNMMTLPLKPWYKRGRNQHGGSNGIISSSPLHHHHSSANAASRSKWKDAAILHHSPPPVLPALPALPAVTDECNSWAMGLVANHHLLHPPESNTIRSNHSSNGISPGGSTRSEASGSSVCSSDGSKGKQQQQHHRKSLLVNISQLDREANEIIQRERARESQRRRLEDDKFYSHSNGQLLAVLPPPPTTTQLLPTVADVPDDESPPLLPPRDPAPPAPAPPGDIHQPQLGKKCARELIHMFNSLTDSSSPPSAAAAPPVPSASSINSPATTKQTTTAELLRLEQQQRADANYSQTGHTYNGQVSSNKESPPPGCSAGTVNVPTADRQVTTTTTTSPPTNSSSSSRLLQTSDESTSIKAVNTNTITRLRVTVPAGSPELAQQQQQQQQQSIFNPKLEVAAAAGSGGGARPKHSPSISCPADDKSPLVNGYSKQQPQQPQLNKTTTTTGGWACQVCTLVNSDARLWCEACTALKPRQLAGRTSSTVNAAGPAVAKETVKTIPAVVQTPEVITTSLTPSTTTTPSLSNSGNNSTVVVATTPSSPEALRQARLAFFLNGQHNNNNINKKPEAIKKDEQKGEDKNNNNNKRHSQHGGIKVSSGCQTQPFVQLPSQIGSSITSGVNGQQRPVSMLAKSESSSNTSVVKSNNKSIIPPPVDSGPSVNSLCNNKRSVVLAPAVLKDVHPTNFALVSPSRTQLSQYLQQQQQASKGSGGQQPAGESGSNDVQHNKSNADELAADEMGEDKRVEVMLVRLEEAIAAGQFDKAAVLAKELAAIKRTPSPSSPASPVPSQTAEVVPVVVVPKPVAAPRSVVPVVVAVQQQSEPVKSSPVSARKPKDNPAVSTAPLPAKRLSHLASPSPLPRKSIRPEEKAEETTKPKEEEIASVSIEPPVVQAPIHPPIQPPVEPLVHPPIQPEEPAEVVPAQPGIVAISAVASVQQQPNISAVSTPEVSVRTKRRTSVKVTSSGQQTTLTFQKKSSANSDENIQKNPQRRTRSCIVDDTFSVEVFIEDRSTHSGPFQLPVRPATTLLELKERMAKSPHGIKVECQRWILGRRLANDQQDQLTLKDYDICPSNSSLFLYVLENNPAPPAAAPNKMKINGLPQPAGPANTQIESARPDPASRKYYNYEEDRYSECEEEEDDGPLEATANNMTQPANPPLTTTTNNIEQQQVDSDQGATGGWDPADNKRPMDPLDPAVTEPKVDYKKLVDLLDGSDVVTNADPFDCPVCLMTVPAGVGVTLRECLHNFCRDCLAHVIEFSDDATVTCPYRDDQYACDAILQELEIKNLVGAKLYEKHLERSMRLAEKAMANTFHCQTADCPGWAVVEADNVNVFRCPVCRQSNCLTCQAIHEGVNCKEFQDRVNQTAETDDDARRTKEMIEALVASGEALSCPQCQVVLMKRWGCDWVRCSVCRTEICWVTKQNRWGPKGKGDTSGGCRCGVDGVKCHPLCNYCH